MDNTKKVYDFILNKFFGVYLGLRRNDQVKDRSVKVPDFNKAYIHNLKKYYQLVNEDSDGDNDSSEAEE